MSLIKQDIEVWVKASEEKPLVGEKYTIKWNGVVQEIMYEFTLSGSFGYYDDGEYLIESIDEVEWLKPIKQVYVLTEDEIKEILTKFLDANVRAHLDGDKYVPTEQFLNSITNK